MGFPKKPAYKPRYNSRYKKRTYNKKKAVKKYKPLSLGGFPRSMLVKLRYCQLVTLNPAAGAIAINNFRANSLFDPDATGAGHQPSNYDRLTAIYDRYTVLGAKCTVTLAPITANQLPGIVCVKLSENGNDLTTIHGSGGISAIYEQPRITRSYNNNAYPNSPQMRPLKTYFSAKKFFGVKNIAGVEPYTADINDNPAEMAYFEVAYVSGDDSADPGAVILNVQIDYVAKMTEPKYTDQS